MNTTFWGPSGWQFLHTLAFIYPEQPSYTDKVKMQKFMNLISYILPCKYCRISFTKYSTTLPITDYLDNRDSVVNWLYKIHNKVNKKLRSQGFCKYDNPELEHVINHYKPIINKINNLCNSNNNNNVQDIITYICNLGRDFFGSIVFNYQGYFSNCYSGDEKIQIVSTYNSFFNSIIPLICSYLSKMNKECSINISRYETSKKLKINNLFRIRYILTQNESYTKLMKWFYNETMLCSFDDKFKSFEDYVKYYSKHIVLSCINPVDIKGDIIKSCRKAAFRKSRTKSSFSKKPRQNSGFRKSRKQSSFSKKLY